METRFFFLFSLPAPAGPNTPDAAGCVGALPLDTLHYRTLAYRELDWSSVNCYLDVMFAVAFIFPFEVQ